jgi:flagellar basal-body rod protein FlgB
MPISDIPILSMLRTRMQWHPERQRLLAENVANRRYPENSAPATSRRLISATR